MPPAVPLRSRRRPDPAAALVNGTHAFSTVVPRVAAPFLHELEASRIGELPLNFYAEPESTEDEAGGFRKKKLRHQMQALTDVSKNPKDFLEEMRFQRGEGVENQEGGLVQVERKEWGGPGTASKTQLFAATEDRYRSKVRATQLFAKTEDRYRSKVR